VSEVTSSHNVNSNNNITGDGVDYDSGLYTVTFPAEETIVPFDVPITDDNILEGDEDFIVTIVSNTLPDGVRRGSRKSATVSITNDDSKYNKC